jgi:TATA-box binding protein (TBP) (component of TFIID and TFIIIB)
MQEEKKISKAKKANKELKEAKEQEEKKISKVDKQLKEAKEQEEKKISKVDKQLKEAKEQEEKKISKVDKQLKDAKEKEAKNIKKKQELCDIVSNSLLLNLIPKEVYVSTITATCKINDLIFNCDNIAKHIDLSLDDIISVSKDDGHTAAGAENVLIHRTLLENKVKKRKKEEKKRTFFNQVSLYVTSKSKENGHVHVKLFKNGSIQMTGSRTVNDIVETLFLVFEKLKNEKTINNEKIEFVSDKKLLDLANISDFKVSMINTNFTIPFQINLAKSHSLLIDKNVESRFERMSHSCVNIKCNCGDKKVSIFVFEKGSIVITGAKNGENVLTAYNFINKFIYSNYKQLKMN